MMTPDTFTEALNRRLGGAYRLRWSNATHTWLIEQKVARAHEVPTGGDPDVTQRVQDGFALVLQFSSSPTMKCPQCRRTLLLPHCTIGEVSCEDCKAASPDTHDNMLWFTGYFPLCDKLITHLEKSSAKREGKWVKEMAAENAAITKSRERLYANKLEAIAGDYWKQAAGIQQVGAGRGPASFGRL